MPRFTNSITGSVVNVDEETAKNLGPEYSAVKDKPESDEKPARRSRN